jgi:voltage-gated potassium channel
VKSFEAPIVAVTITTLGFGDITPNDTRVRILVMIEAFLGLLIAGGLASVLFSWHPETSQRPTCGKEA